MNNINKDIIAILKAYLNKDYNFTISSNLDELCQVSTKLCVSPIIGYTLHKNELYKDIHNFDEVMFICATRYEKQTYYRKLINKLFNENNIDYLFIKGNTLAKYYDEEYLRYSTDIDVFVSKNNYYKARDVLVQNSKLRQVVHTENEIALAHKNISIDLQNKLTNDDETIDVLYDDVLSISKNHELSNEYKYFFILTHAYKHLKECYISIEFLIDFYYINKLDLDRSFINRKLESINLTKFNNINIQTINVLFNGAKSNETIDSYIEFLFNIADVDGAGNMILVGVGNDGNKYLLRRLFPDYKKMTRMYPEIRENKLLLPVYYVKRLYDRLKQGRFNQALNEVKANSSVDYKQVELTKQLFKDIGIN